MDNKSPIKNVLVTGGAGRIGSYFIEYAARRYSLRMVDRVAWPKDLPPFPGAEAHVGNLEDINFCRKLCQGMDAVLHLAADPSPEATMESLLPNNIVSVTNLYEAAAEAGCKRFVFASSIHAIEGYPDDMVVRPEMPTWPRNLYGVTKVFGESVGIYYAYQRNLPTIAIRIGAYIHPRLRYPLPEKDRKIFTHPDDLNPLIVACLETDVTYAIVHAGSNNRHKRLDIEATIRDFGYDPKGDAYSLFPEGNTP
jgi:nucleoside-diphosphate-sugar epimerase